jgi:hypothetical protein
MRKERTVQNVYIIFWTASFCCEILMWIPVWQPHFTKMSIVNMSLYVMLFSSIHFIARKIALQLPVLQNRVALYKLPAFWLLLCIPFIYIPLAWCSDKYIMNFEYTTITSAYLLRSFKMAIPYMIVPVFFGGIWVYKDKIINGLKLLKVLAEQEKVFAEQQRILAEQRNAVERERRIAAEREKAGEEQKRMLAEEAKMLAEEKRIVAEEKRVVAEVEKNIAEKNMMALASIEDQFNYLNGYDRRTVKEHPGKLHVVREAEEPQAPEPEQE